MTVRPFFIIRLVHWSRSQLCPAVAGGFGAIGGVPLGTLELFRRGGNSRTHVRPADAGSLPRQGWFRLAALTLVEINLRAFVTLVVGLT